MQFFKIQILAAVTLASSLLLSSTASGAAVEHKSNTAPLSVVGEKRGEVSDVVQIIRKKNKVGSDFCSTLLHLPPYATTKTVTVTNTVKKTATASTTVKTTSITKTGLPVIAFSTDLSVVRVTPAVTQTVASPVFFISTVTTITQAVTSTTVVTQTVVSYTANQARRAETAVPLPRWLVGHKRPAVSRACSSVVVPRTKTNTKTVTATRTVTPSRVTVGKTATVVVTPTSISVVKVTSTQIQAVLTGVITATESSLVPVTATQIDTTVVTVTETAFVTLPIPSSRRGRIRINKADDNSFLGYVENESGLFSYTPNIASALIVTLPSADQFPASGGPLNLATTGSYPFLGAASTYGETKYNLAPGSSNYVYMAQLNEVPANSQSAADAPNSFADNTGNPGVSESKIWNYNAATGALTITWTNSDGTSVSSPTLAADYYNYLIWTADLSAFSTRHTAGPPLIAYFEADN
ncbi:hypothetical protein CF327_g2973 [Tilletia walkeri]|nr:hypothetical protein CF327_g2973 [Tilletia walkeri]